MRGALLCTLLFGCAAPVESVSLIVRASGLPERAGTLMTLLLLDGRPAAEVPVHDIAALAGRLREVSLLLRLPRGSAGPFQVALGVKDLDGCLVGAGVADGFLDAAEASVRVPLTPVGPERPPCEANKVPVIAQMSPSALRTQEPARVTLRGFGFHPGVALSLSGQPARGLVYVSPVELSALSPKAMAGMGDVEVRNPDGGSALKVGLLRYYPSSLRFRAQTIKLSSPTRFASAADLDGDGWTDLIYTDHQQARLMVLRNRAGAFPEAPLLGFQGAPLFTALALGDLDGDGRPDAAVAPYDGPGGAVGKIQILLNMSDGGGFRAGGDLETSIPPPEGVSIADVNADGRPDIITATSLGCPRGGFCGIALLNAGGASFQAEGRRPIILSPSFLPLGHVAADFNGDGLLDLAFGSKQNASYSPGLSLLMNQGQGSFVPGGLFLGVDPGSSRRVLHNLLTADLDRDGLPDLVLEWISPTLTTVMRNQGRGVFARDFGVAYPREGGCRPLALGDFDGDGYPDLVLGSITNSGVHVLKNRGDGTFPASLPPAIPTVSGLTGPQVAQAADLDRDGRQDLVVFSSTEGALTLLMNDSE